jgi:hypothetical protein
MAQKIRCAAFLRMRKDCASLKFSRISGRLSDLRKCFAHQRRGADGRNAFPACGSPEMMEKAWRHHRAIFIDA